MKILIAESLDLEILKQTISDKSACLHEKGESPSNVSGQSGKHFFYKPDVSLEDLESSLCQYDALVVRPKEVTAKAIHSTENLKLIIRGGTGVNSIDLSAAKEKGVVVENTPNQNSTATAEYTFNLIMNLVGNRKIIESDSDSRSQTIGSELEYQGQELSGKKIAIVGMGNIGRKVAKMADAFDMEVIYHSRSEKDLDFKYFAKLEGLLKEKADIISLHTPLTEDTNSMISTDEFSLMKEGTILINCARPQLVDSNAFADALQKNIISSAGIDGDYHLIEDFIKADINKKCLLTHHIADSTKQAQEKITREVLKQIFTFFDDNKIINRCV